MDCLLSTRSGTLLMQPKLPGVRMDFSSRVIFQCRLSPRVFTAPVCNHVCSDLCAGSKSPALPAIYHRLDTQIMAHTTQSTFVWTPKLWHTLLSQPSFGHPNYGTHYSVNLCLDTQIMAHTTQSTFVWTPRLWHTLLSQPSFGHPDYGTCYSVNLRLDTQIMAHATQSTFVWTPRLWHTLLSQPSFGHPDYGTRYSVNLQKPSDRLQLPKRQQEN